MFERADPEEGARASSPSGFPYSLMGSLFFTYDWFVVTEEINRFVEDALICPQWETSGHCHLSLLERIVAQFPRLLRKLAPESFSKSAIHVTISNRQRRGFLC